MQLNGLFAFQDSALEVALAQLFAALVGHGIEGEKFGIVVAVAVFFLQHTVYISHVSVVVNVITGVESLPPPAACRVLTGRTGSEQQREGEPQGKAICGFKWFQVGVGVF